MASILTTSGLGDPSRLTQPEQNRKPDITNTASREVFEIKPWNQEGLEAGRKQVQGYLDALNKGMGVPPGERGTKGPAKYPFLTGIDEKGELAVQFHAGKMVWRLTWKTTEAGVIQYKWQKTSKTDRDEIREAGEGQWVDITEQDAAAYGQEVAEQVDRSVSRNERLFKAMDATNAAQDFVGIVASAVLMAAIFAGLSAGPRAGVGARPVTPAPAPRYAPVAPPAPPPGAPGPMMPPPTYVPPAPPPVHAPMP